MRMLVTTVGAYGHLHPVVPLAAAAVNRGAEVRIATGRDLASWVRSCGFEFEAVGLSQRELLAPQQSFPPGAGTMLGALLHGLPHVVVPQQKMSQLRNAQRIGALGIGIHVAYDAPPDASARGVQAVLDDPSFGCRAAAMGAALAELPSPEAVLDAVTTSLL